MTEITSEHTMIIFFEMNQLKVEFFDCENFITTIDDLVVNLIEALNYDKNNESLPEENNEQQNNNNNN